MAGRGSELWPADGIDNLHAVRRLVPLYEQVGDTAKALDAYRTLILQWENGDPEAREEVSAFRERVRGLGG